MSDFTTKIDETCLMMFSGGYDSLLAPCYLIEKGYKVLLVTYDNGVEKNLDSVDGNVQRLKKLYGDKIDFLGIKNIMGLWRELFLISYMMKRHEFDYNLLPIEMICLSCRCAMYVRSVVECLEAEITHLAEGARKSQKYPEQQPQVINVFKDLCKEYSVKLVLPVYEISGKEQLKEELIKRSIIPKTTEPYCAFNMPLYEYAPLKDRVSEMVKFLESYLVPRAHEAIEKLPTVIRFRKGSEGLV